MTPEQELVERLRAASISIRNDGTASQVGLTEDECEIAASTIERLVKERDEAKAGWQEAFSLGVEHQNARATAEAQVERLSEALTKIAAFDDEAAQNYLVRTGSLSMFDEPGSVEIARATLSAGRGE